MSANFEIILFYDEVSALSNKLPGCCVHEKYLQYPHLQEEGLKVWLQEISTSEILFKFNTIKEKNHKNHNHPTDLLYALRQSSTLIPHIFADADDIIIQVITTLFTIHISLTGSS